VIYLKNKYKIILTSMTTIIDKFPGSVDVSSNLNVDSTTLFVDSLERMVGIGNSIPNEKLDVSGTIKATGLTVGNSSYNYFPQYAILMWSGATQNIPSGWALCDGSNGTPDLRGHFVRGTTTSGKVGTIGGSYNFKFNSAAHWGPHRHNYNQVNASGNHSHNGSTNTSYHAHNAFGHRDGYGRGDAYSGLDTPGGDEGIYNATNAGPTSTTGSHVHPTRNSNSYYHTHASSLGQTGAPSPGTISLRPPYYALYYIMKT
jgi:hypothetical protein